MMEVTDTWQGGLKFEATGKSGVSIVFDAKDAVSPAGPNPMEGILMALGACTGMDVIHILRKMKQDVTGLEIKVSGEQAAEDPKAFTKISVRFTFKGNNLKKTEIERAVNLSQTKYCLVAATLRKGVEIEHYIEPLQS